MLIDTHCHLNMIVKKTFDTALLPENYQRVQEFLNEAAAKKVSTIINVGTSLIESTNCVLLAQKFSQVYATVGIHPNDCTADWLQDFKEIEKLVANKANNKIVGIGECGIDTHYPDYNLERQRAAFKAQIELALEHNLALVVHTRDAGEETLRCLEEFKNSPLRGTMHCFSETQDFAEAAIQLGFVLGIGGTITYPKNNALRATVKNSGLENIILETDAPFLPPQYMRGQQNTPAQIAHIADYCAELFGVTPAQVADITTFNARRVFQLTA